MLMDGAEVSNHCHVYGAFDGAAGWLCSVPDQESFCESATE